MNHGFYEWPLGNSKMTSIDNVIYFYGSMKYTFAPTNSFWNLLDFFIKWKSSLTHTQTNITHHTPQIVYADILFHLIVRSLPDHWHMLVVNIRPLKSYFTLSACHVPVQRSFYRYIHFLSSHCILRLAVTILFRHDLHFST